MSENQPEVHRVSGSQLVEKIKELVHEGNVRRVMVEHEGRVVLELPLTVVGVGVLIAPVLAALGAFAAVATECTIRVEREPGSRPPSA